MEENVVDGQVPVRGEEWQGSDRVVKLPTFSIGDRYPWADRNRQNPRVEIGQTEIRGALASGMVVFHGDPALVPRDASAEN